MPSLLNASLALSRSSQNRPSNIVVLPFTSCLLTSIVCSITSLSPLLSILIFCPRTSRTSTRWTRSRSSPSAGWLNPICRLSDVSRPLSWALRLSTRFSARIPASCHRLTKSAKILSSCDWNPRLFALWPPGRRKALPNFSSPCRRGSATVGHCRYIRTQVLIINHFHKL